MGYYTKAEWKGIKVTDENGASLTEYTFAKDITVYPYFIRGVMFISGTKYDTAKIMVWDKLGSMTPVVKAEIVK